MPDKVHIPDVVEPDEKLPQDLVALRRFAWLMDAAVAIPGTKYRVGLDAALGIIPGIGDVVGAMFASWIVVGAVRHRVPAWVIGRMVLNVAIDVLFGAVPLAGDVFDFLFDENIKNMRLLEKYRDRKRPPRSGWQMTRLTLLIIGGFAFLSLMAVAGFVALIIWLIGQR